MKNKVKLQKRLGFFKGLKLEEKEWQGMPEFNNYEKAIQQVIVHFETYEAVRDFEKIVNQKISKKTKYIWYPRKERRNIKSLIYKNES